MTLKEFIQKKKIKQLMISKITGINPSKLSLYINSWCDLNEQEIESISKFLNISKKEIKSNNIKEK